MKSQEQHRRGLVQVTVGYLIWGLLPMFWKALSHVSSFELLMHRILWCALWSMLFFALQKKNPFAILKHTWRSSRPLLLLGSSLVVAVNWLSYIYAVTSGQLIQASLGYYLCPILIVLLGVAVFRETMTGLQKLALVFCIFGVIYATLQAGGFPWLSVLIGGTFALYGTMKKFIGAQGVAALLSDTAVLSPAVIIVMIVMGYSGDAMFLFHSFGTDILLVLAGLATLLPLMLFIQGTISIPYKTVGFLQFITPTMAFFLGVIVYREPFSIHQGITFLLIIIGVICYVISLLKRPRRGEMPV